MTNREMVLKLFSEQTDEQIEKWYTDELFPKPYESICYYCQKKYGKCRSEFEDKCPVTSTEWLDSEAVS